MKLIYLIISIRMFILTFLISIGNLIAIDYKQMRTDENIYLYTILICISTLLFGFKKQEFEKIDKKILYIFSGFWLICFLSIYLNDELNWNIVLVYWIFPFLILINKKIADNINEILIAFFMAGILLLLNLQESNTFGLLITLCFVALYSLKVNNEFRSVLILFAPITVYLVYLTESRTTLLSYTIFIVVYYMIHYIFKKQSITKLLITTSIMILFQVSMIIFTDNFIELIFNKRANTKSNFLADRQIFWEGTLENGLTYLGNGKFYFLQNYSIGDSHNFFIEILGIFGVIPLLMFFYMMYLIFKKLIKSKSKDFAVPILFFLYFYTTGLTENLFFVNNRLISYHILFIVFLSFTLSLKTNIKEVHQK